MNGFVTRLLNVTYGMTPGARPLIAPRFAPGADVPGTRPNYANSAVEERGSERQMDRGPEIGLPAADVLGAERGGHRGPPVQAFGNLSLQPERRASESAEVRGLSPTFRSGMPDQSDKTRNPTALYVETQETSEQRAPGAPPVVNSAAVTEPPALADEQPSSSTAALRAKQIPAHLYPSETSEADHGASRQTPTNNYDGAEGGGAHGATVIAASRREATALAIVSAGDQTEGTPSGREETERRQERARSLASRWMESQREADGRTVEMPGPPVGSQPYAHTRQTVRDRSNSPNVADSPDVAGPPVVRVTIGRIEVRAISQPPPPPRSPRPAAPRLSLDEYLASQARRGL
jgi:hypothetical protein